MYMESIPNKNHLVTYFKWRERERERERDAWDMDWKRYILPGGYMVVKITFISAMDNVTDWAILFKSWFAKADQPQPFLDLCCFISRKFYTYEMIITALN